MQSSEILKIRMSIFIWGKKIVLEDFTWLPPPLLLKPEDLRHSLKVVTRYFLLVCFLSLTESTCGTRKNVFLIHFKSSFHSRENQNLEF